MIDQTLDAHFYEVVIVKNFNMDLSSYILENGPIIRNIFADVNVGEAINIAINNSSGKVLSFLDDDDLFLSNKLEYVMNRFNCNPNLVYFHNSNIAFYKNVESAANIDIEKSHKTINLRRFYKSKELKRFMRLSHRYKGGHNLSSISIRRDLVMDYKEELRTITAQTDGFFFFISLISRMEVEISNEKLSYYRRHSQSTSVFTLSKGNLTKLALECSKQLQTSRVLNERAGPILKRYIGGDIAYWSIRRSVFLNTRSQFSPLDLLAFPRPNLKTKMILISMLFVSIFSREIMLKLFEHLSAK